MRSTITHAESIEYMRRGRSLRQLCADYGLPPSDAAHLSRMLTGGQVAGETERRIRRALGLMPPPRRLHRVVMSDEQFRAWQGLTPAQRNAALGI